MAYKHILCPVVCRKLHLDANELIHPDCPVLLGILLTDDPIDVLNTAASTPRTRPLQPC